MQTQAKTTQGTAEWASHTCHPHIYLFLSFTPPSATCLSFKPCLLLLLLNCAAIAGSSSCLQMWMGNAWKSFPRIWVQFFPCGLGANGSPDGTGCNLLWFSLAAASAAAAAPAAVVYSQISILLLHACSFSWLDSSFGATSILSRWHASQLGQTPWTLLRDKLANFDQNDHSGMPCCAPRHLKLRADFQYLELPRHKV